VDATATPTVTPFPPGPWAVAVSGGADSVALLLLLANRPDLSLHVVHLDHQLRGADSDADAAFVADLAKRLNLPCTIARREQIQPDLPDLPANPSAQYRDLRLHLFRQVVRQHRLSGVILAHHGDDQAETILLRLLRGSGPAGLRGMAARCRIGDLIILRPALGARRRDMQAFLNRLGQSWREDASNQSDAYLRNRVRKWLADRPELFDPLLRLGRACDDLVRWTRRAAPRLPDRFPARQLAALPPPLAREAARRWLLRQGAPPAQADRKSQDRLLAMAADAASPAIGQFPGNLTVRRRRGEILPLAPPTPSASPPSPAHDSTARRSLRGSAPS
jgi:tRNA(Ile)-lysidine synthetase-like protein